MRSRCVRYRTQQSILGAAPVPYSGAMPWVAYGETRPRHTRWKAERPQYAWRPDGPLHHGPVGGAKTSRDRSSCTLQSKSVNGQTAEEPSVSVCVDRAPSMEKKMIDSTGKGLELRTLRPRAVHRRKHLLSSISMFMVSSWWLIATFWIGACVGIFVASLLQMARHGDDRERQHLSGAEELSRGGNRATPNA